MDTTNGGYPTTEQAAAHLESSPRTLERYRARGGGPPCVSCCDRVHGLRSGLEELIAKDGRPVGVASEDNCVRNGRKIVNGENKCFVVALRRQTYANVRMSYQMTSLSTISV